MSPSKFLCWSPNPQCDGIWRWGFGEVTRLAKIVHSLELWPAHVAMGAHVLGDILELGRALRELALRARRVLG